MFAVKDKNHTAQANHERAHLGEHRQQQDPESADRTVKLTKLLIFPSKQTSQEIRSCFPFSSLLLLTSEPLLLPPPLPTSESIHCMNWGRDILSPVSSPSRSDLPEQQSSGSWLHSRGYFGTTGEGSDRRDRRGDGHRATHGIAESLHCTLHVECTGIKINLI